MNYLEKKKHLTNFAEPPLHLALQNNGFGKIDELSFSGIHRGGQLFPGNGL